MLGERLLRHKDLSALWLAMSDFPDDQFSGEGHQGEDHSRAPDDENQEQGIHRDLFFGVIRN